MPAVLTMTAALFAMGLLGPGPTRADTWPSRGAVDSRIRVAVYNADDVYRLRGRVGFQIDLQFEAGETFVGLGAGDLEGLSFVAQDNHLFIKPKAQAISTNLTVLTNRRDYQFDYSAKPAGPEQTRRHLPLPQAEVIYALRFVYPQSKPDANRRVEDKIAAQLASTVLRQRNSAYWFCGDASLKPIEASDDGVHTRLIFAGRAELPAIFVRNEDGSESLLNFNMDAGAVILHRVARQFSLRRGKLKGCIVNRGFIGGGERLDSGTVSPLIERSAVSVGP